jgi:hypothetical protein
MISQDPIFLQPDHCYIHYLIKESDYNKEEPTKGTLQISGTLRHAHHKESISLCIPLPHTIYIRVSAIFSEARPIRLVLFTTTSLLDVYVYRLSWAVLSSRGS